MPTFTARTLHTGFETLHDVRLSVEDGHLRAIQADVADEDPRHDAQRFEVLTPAFLDVHVHGAMGHDFMRAGLDDMDTVGRFLAKQGVGHYLPTTVTTSVEPTLRALNILAKFIQRKAPHDAATPLGVHLEGPFLCAAKRGVHPPQDLLGPDIATFERFQEAAEGTIRLLTLAPELPGAAELIEFATARGVRISLGHSNATYAETQEAIRRGATSATHTFNAMHVLDHREPGIAGAVLDCSEVFAEAIVDGVHLHPAMVRLWLRAKGEDRAILVTDGMSATGMPDGIYRLGDLTVEVREGVCRSGGALAGSVLTMERAVSNLCALTGTPLGTAVRLASANPAAMLGVVEQTMLTVGGPANLNIFDLSGKRQGLILNGEQLVG